jgi:hypothetical protein
MMAEAALEATYRRLGNDKVEPAEKWTPEWPALRALQVASVERVGDACAPVSKRELPQRFTAADALFAVAALGGYLKKRASASPKRCDQ